MPVDVLKTRVVLFSKPRKMIMVIATITTSTASSPRSGQSVEKRSLEGKWIKLLARGVGRFLNDSRVWTRAFVQLEWRAHVCGAISRKSICGSFPDKAEFEKCRGRKKNVTRAKRGKKFIYTDFNSTFVFIRDSSVSNEFHDTFRTFETFPYRDLRVYGTLNSRKNVYIYIYISSGAHAPRVISPSRDIESTFEERVGARSHRYSKITDASQFPWEKFPLCGPQSNTRGKRAPVHSKYFPSFSSLWTRIPYIFPTLPPPPCLLLRPPPCSVGLVNLR